MIRFSPAPFRHGSLGQPPAAVLPAPVPPPGPDPLFTGYTGFPGLVEALAVLAVTGAAAWVGIRTAMSGGDTALKAAGWTAGIGSALFGLLYLGAKSGIGPDIGLPTVRVSPS